MQGGDAVVDMKDPQEFRNPGRRRYSDRARRLAGRSKFWDTSASPESMGLSRLRPLPSQRDGGVDGLASRALFTGTLVMNLRSGLRKSCTCT
jgi:hypothetical protein